MKLAEVAERCLSVLGAKLEGEYRTEQTDIGIIIRLADAEESSVVVYL